MGQYPPPTPCIAPVGTTIPCYSSWQASSNRYPGRGWWKQADIDDGLTPGTTTEESDELKRLRWENAELRRANEILKTASAFFAAAELDRHIR